MSEYHAGPLHLNASDLERLGLDLTGDETQRPPGIAAAWAASITASPDRAKRGPALTQPGWRLPDGLTRGGILVARVQRGVDLFIVSYDAKPIELSGTDLVELGLKLRHG